LVPDAGNRALQLLHEHAGATVLAGWVDSYPAPPTKSTIELNRSEIERILGVGLPDAEVERILAALEYHYEAPPWGWAITPPDFRTDIQAGAADIIEDLARVSGYDRLPSRLLPTELPTPLGNLRLEYEDRIKDTLADIGLFECITYSLSSSEAEAKLHPAQEHAQIEFVALQNPISPERSVLRRSLLPGLLEVAARNTQQAERVALFELGAVFQPNGHQLPHEPQRLAIVLTGRCQQPTWDDPLGLSPKTFDFFDMKGVLEVLFQQFQLDAVTYEPLKTSAHLHPGRAATVHCSQHCVGQFGELHPKVAAAFGLHERAVLVAELDLEILLFLVPQRVGYQPFTTLPAAKRDIAVIVPDDMPLARVLTELRAAGGELLTDVALFDVYKGDSIPPGTKSLAFALTYQPKEKTLTEKEIDKAHQKIEGRLVHVLKAVVRGKEAAGS
jgi:phenylalanyl-tRNA synthetase beta chain